MSDKVFVGDVGIRIVITITEDGVPVNISGATTKTIAFTKGTVRNIRTASFVTDGSDGKIVYISTAEDFTTAGTWKVQPFVVLSSTQFYHGEIASIEAFGTL